MTAPAIPKTVVILGKALQLDCGDWFYKWTKRPGSLLCSSVSGKRLYVLPGPDKAIDVENDGTVKDAKKLFRKFSPKGNLDFETGTGNSKGTLKKRGTAHSIVYESNKFGRKSSFIHEFKTKPRVWTDKANEPTIVVIEGGKIKVTARGIEG
jgi:hypothetical protein